MIAAIAAGWIFGKLVRIVLLAPILVCRAVAVSFVRWPVVSVLGVVIALVVGHDLHL
jgi:hypothetical protein